MEMGAVSRHRARYVAVLLGAVLLASASAAAGGSTRRASAQQAGIDGLRQAIDAILADPRLDGAQADVVVRSASGGETLYSHTPDNRLVPASNAKLYSSIAAMKVLGPDYRFSTTVAAGGSQSGSTLAGNLYLKGTGDPTVQPADYDGLAGAVAAAGIKTVTGELVADDSFFDHRRLGDNWAWDNNPFSFQPEISALTVAADAVFDVGSLTVVIRPGLAAGDPAQVGTDPQTSFVQIDDQATTGAPGSPSTISVERQLGVNTIVVTGSIPAGGAAESHLSTVSNPTGYAASLFADALARHSVQLIRGTSAGSTPSDTRTIAQRQSIPLSQLLPPFLKLSNNAHAEILVKAMGRRVRGQGTWDAGLSVVDEVIGGLGVETGKLQLVDGSGLSNLDFVPAQQSTAILIAAQRQPWFSAWYDALPIAGEPEPLVGGTLSSRMRNTRAAGNVHAKTGTLTGASALSGYATDADGERLVFSVMENNYLSAAPKDLEDAVAVELAGFSRGRGVLGPPARARQPAPAVVDVHGRAVECSWVHEGCGGR
jgi:D-alanyl-D-alanine carboxypeptidase/D-alanyl-D-alanine-endopeptidase (penicillin-binding protein 4)